jgi:hypothetical protein
VDHQSGAKDSLPQLKAAGTRRSLLWSLALPTCVAVAVLVAAIGAYTPRAVIQVAMDEAIPTPLVRTNSMVARAL